MMTVRFSSGVSVQYNDAHWVTHHESEQKAILQRKKDGEVLAIVYGPCIVELTQPCRTYQAAPPPSDFRLTQIETEIRGLKRKITEALKGRK